MLLLCSKIAIVYLWDIFSIAGVGIGIWDTKFGVYHSWAPLADSKKLHGQVQCNYVTVSLKLATWYFCYAVYCSIIHCIVCVMF